MTGLIGLHGHGHVHGSSTPGAGPSVAPSPKPSLPNLKLTQPAYASSLHPSSSSISLRSSSTGGSSSIRSVGSGLPPAPNQGQGPGQLLKGKSMSTPPLPMTSMKSNGHGHNGKHTRVEKKGSDPTPLRQSTGAGSDLETVESPSTLDGASSYASSIVDQDKSTGTARLPSRSSTLPPTHPLSTSSTSAARTRQISGTSTPVVGVTIGTGPSSASSSTSHLSVPPPGGPKRESSATPVQLERTSSHHTTSAHSANSGTSAISGGDQASLGVRNGDRPTAPRRVRSISGASFAASSAKGKQLPLSARRGVTPGRPLKSHTCTWDHDLQLALRLPISKERSGTPAPGSKSRAPLLGEGSESASGLQLIIEQLPTASATAHAHPKSSGPVPPEQTGNETPPAVKGERTIFGKVDIDLAAFAGRGKTTRKFLLGGSRTNATVKLTVDMSWIGGDGNWVAPPLQEGHHVTQMMKDVMGGRDANQDLERDLALVKTPSASSTDSSASHAPSTKSRNGSSLNLARAPSATISQPRPQYKTYDQHLLSPDSAIARAATPNSAAHHAAKTENASTPTGPSSSPTRSMFPIQWHHRPHHHHHHNHRHSHHHARSHLIHGITELSPESVIEHIFNPYESHEESPFTFVLPPQAASSLNLPSPLRDDEEHHEHAPAEHAEHPEPEHRHRLGGWRRRRDQKKGEMGRTASGISVVMNAAAGSGGGGGLHAPFSRSGTTGASTPVAVS